MSPLLIQLMFPFSVLTAQCSTENIWPLRKTALVFGEKDYKYVASLTNPINDAEDVSDSLRKIGFDVWYYYNATLKEMNEYSDEWIDQLDNYDVALFYFSGHGGEISGINYLYPVDANPKKSLEVPYATFPANLLLEKMDNSQTLYNIMILDACRVNPFIRSLTRNTNDEGLAPMSGKGTFVAYAAAPGKVAYDVHTRNSPYTGAFLKYITTPDISIEEVFTRANSRVRAVTNDAQIPFISTSFSKTYCFRVAQPNISSKKTHFVAPVISGKLALNGTQTLLARVNDSMNLVHVMDPVSLVEVRQPIKTSSKNARVAWDASGNLFILDSLNRIRILAPESDNGAFFTLNDALIDFTPIDNNKSYILSVGDSGYSVLKTYDFKAKKVSNTIGVFSSPTAIYFDSHSNQLYVNTITGKRSGIAIIDAKTHKIIKSVENIGGGGEIRIDRKNDRLYATTASKTLQVLDRQSLQLLHEIPFMVKQIALSHDGNHLYALQDSSLLVFGTQGYSVIKRMNFKTVTSGMSLSWDGKGFVSLPARNRVVQFALEGYNLGRDTTDPDIELTEFIKEQKRIADSTNKTLKDSVLKILHDSLQVYTLEMKQTLGNDFGWYPEEPLHDYVNNNFRYAYVIFKRNFSAKYVGIRFSYHFEKSEVNVSVFAFPSENQPETFRILIGKPDWPDIKERFRKAFKANISRLK